MGLWMTKGSIQGKERITPPLTPWGPDRQTRGWGGGDIYLAFAAHPKKIVDQQSNAVMRFGIIE